MTSKTTPEAIVQNGGRQLVSGAYDSLTAQLRPDEKILVLLHSSGSHISVELPPGQGSIDFLKQSEANVAGFFAVPKTMKTT